MTERVIGCCFKAHKTLGSGFLEKVCENALMIELERAGLRARQQSPIAVSYEGHRVGEYLADVIVEDQIVCELKVGDAIGKEHEIQLVNYLVATGLDTGLLIHFGKSVTVKRKFRQHHVSKDHD
ncbi:MAG: GxxExxY protein [Betaproteobacteria bacterium]|nr:GxxExxY protein [Betaproteobacteria bacterium]